MHAKGRNAVPAAALPSELQAPAPMPEVPDFDEPTQEQSDLMKDALVCLAFSPMGGDAGVKHAAVELSKKRGLSWVDALPIVRHVQRNMGAVGRKRKAMDPETAAYLVGETRARFAIIMSVAMRPENFQKGGGAVAIKAAQAMAVLDGCPVDGMVQIVGHIQHEHEVKVQDPERVAIALGILETVNRRRVIDVEADTA
jgi:hypothetical protein